MPEGGTPREGPRLVPGRTRSPVTRAERSSGRLCAFQPFRDPHGRYRFPVRLRATIHTHGWGCVMSRSSWSTGPVVGPGRSFSTRPSDPSARNPESDQHSSVPLVERSRATVRLRCSVTCCSSSGWCSHEPVVVDRPGQQADGPLGVERVRELPAPLRPAQHGEHVLASVGDVFAVRLGQRLVVLGGARSENDLRFALEAVRSWKFLPGTTG